MATVSANKLELLQIAEAVAREKAIDRKIVLAAMEDAIAKAARSRYGSETEVRAEIDAKSGELHLSRHMLVMEAVENPAMQISLEEARRRHGFEIEAGHVETGRAEIAGFDICVRLFSLNRGPWLSPIPHRLRGLSLVDCGLALAARETRP